MRTIQRGSPSPINGVVINHERYEELKHKERELKRVLRVQKEVKAEWEEIKKEFTQWIMNLNYYGMVLSRIIFITW